MFPLEAAAVLTDGATPASRPSVVVLGGVVGLIVTRMTRAIGTQASARRLIRATHRDLADLADLLAVLNKDRIAIIVPNSPIRSSTSLCESR